MNILAILLLIPAIVAYSISQLQQHQKLKGQSQYRDFDSFWGVNSWNRKYKNPRQPAPDNWYYEFFKVKYKERFPLSATMLVFLTDGYHLMQFFFFIFISLSVAFALGLTWWWFGIWIGVHVIHAGLYKLLSR